MKSAVPYFEKAAAGLRDVVSMVSTSESHFFDEEKFSITDIKKNLNDLSVERKLDAMKRILAAVSSGRDVGVLFPDVVKNISATNLELKRLVYIYIVAYANISPPPASSEGAHQGSFGVASTQSASAGGLGSSSSSSSTQDLASVQQLALLSVNSFQRDLKDRNQLVRAAALKAMASVRVLEIIQIIVMAVSAASQDSSPFVRKQAALCVPKVCSLDPDQIGSMTAVLLKLAADGDPCVAGAAFASYRRVVISALVLDSQSSPEERDRAEVEALGALHGLFRKMIDLLPTAEAPMQVALVDLLLRYGRTFLPDPNAFTGVVSSSSSSPPATSTGEAELSDDHTLLLRVLTGLLQSQSKAVVISAISALFYLAPRRDPAALLSSSSAGAVEEKGKASEWMKAASKAGLRTLRIADSETKGVLLEVLTPLIHALPELFRPSVKQFFIQWSDSTALRLLKLDILIALTDEMSVAAILRECQAYIQWGADTGGVRGALGGAAAKGSEDADMPARTGGEDSGGVEEGKTPRAFLFAKKVIDVVMRAALRVPSVRESCLSGLVRLLDSPNETIAAEAVVAVRALLHQQAETEKEGAGGETPGNGSGGDAATVTARLVTTLSDLRAPQARASVIWIIGRYLDRVPRLARETLRRLVGRFSDEAREVKIQILGLATKLWCQNYRLRAQRRRRLTGGTQTPDASNVEEEEEAEVVGSRVDAQVRFCLDLAALDADSDLRDLARCRSRLLQEAKRREPEGGAEGAESVLGKFAVAFANDALPSVVRRQRSAGLTETEGGPTTGADGRPPESLHLQHSLVFTLGSLAQTTGRALEGFLPLPHSRNPAEVPSPSVRAQGPGGKGAASATPSAPAVTSISSDNFGHRAGDGAGGSGGRVGGPKTSHAVPVVRNALDLDAFYDTPEGDAFGGMPGAETQQQQQPHAPHPHMNGTRSAEGVGGGANGYAGGSVSMSRPQSGGAPPVRPDSGQRGVHGTGSKTGVAVYGEDDESDDDDDCFPQRTATSTTTAAGGNGGGGGTTTSMMPPSEKEKANTLEVPKGGPQVFHVGSDPEDEEDGDDWKFMPPPNQANAS
uniref:Clathrin/coatomer adaptor adaptin-like N-terminal domain-containing protein n=1 Tax=Chromera velia CCMP2878 TaxID=1169474 RepID=A0A0G4I2U1_9ALVE|eukprot:Cvel_10491.t1-p1 / transcript=Cvel_10491.t1 / gene=Cvel_10491 / organism=Chromera_velia_CCMP2878 / gene_product=AP-3 complex subunit beta-2, putative / transcript_product=AP-3 complex subunit beta-2, putative / location=Cvel_scaffold634:10913-21804(-) / protein_length=1078 / sequence_SO=supercontig / SO=protein_coding / is_pseudo=false